MIPGRHVGLFGFSCGAYYRQFYLHQPGSDKIVCAILGKSESPSYCLPGINARRLPASVDKKRPLFPGSTGNGPGARKKFEPPAERTVFPYPRVDRKATRRKNLGKFLGFPLFQSLGNSGRKSVLFPTASPGGKVRPCSSSDEESGARKKFEPPAERTVFPHPGVDRKATRRKNLGKFLGFPLFQSLGNSGRKSVLFPAANPGGKVRPCSSADEESGDRKKFKPPAKRLFSRAPEGIVKRHDGKI